MSSSSALDAQADVTTIRPEDSVSSGWVGFSNPANLEAEEIGLPPPADLLLA